MPYKAFAEDNQYCVYKLDDNGEQTGSSLGCHPTMAEADSQVQALYAQEETDRQAQNLFSGFWGKLKSLFKNRVIKDVDSWDGSASQWPDTASYCRSCLINENEGAEEDWVQGKCKLPVRGPGDSADTYVRQAVHAAAARFNQVQASSESKEKARKELVKAYKEMDEEPPAVLTRALSMSRLYEAIWMHLDEMMDYNNYLVDMYVDDQGLYGLVTNSGKLYRYPVIMQGDNIGLGTPIEVMEMHQPVQSRTVIRRQSDGKYRWFSVSGTAVLNRSGEIDSRDLFDSFIEHAESTGEYPIRQFYHQGESYRTGQADFLARDDYCYITSGIYDDTDIAKAERLAQQNKPDYWGESIGFLPTVEPELIEISQGIKIPVYRKGINKEISTLPENQAAHLFTRTEVTMSLEGKVRDAYLQLWLDAGMTEEDALAWLAKNPQARNRAIEDGGMITREGEETPPEEPEGDSQPEGEALPDIEIDDSVIEAVGQTVVQSETFTQLSDRVGQIETQLAERSKAEGTLTQAIERLNQRLDKLEGVESARQQVIQEDTPAKFQQARRVVYRPRFNGTVDPGEDGTPFAERALKNAPKEIY